MENFKSLNFIEKQNHMKKKKFYILKMNVPNLVENDTAKSENQINISTNCQPYWMYFMVVIMDSNQN